MTSNNEKPVCKYCESESVELDALAEWNVEKQAWELLSTHNSAYCAQCDGETRLIWVQA